MLDRDTNDSASTAPLVNVSLCLSWRLLGGLPFSASPPARRDRDTSHKVTAFTEGNAANYPLHGLECAAVGPNRIASSPVWPPGSTGLSGLPSRSSVPPPSRPPRQHSGPRRAPSGPGPRSVRGPKGLCFIRLWRHSSEQPVHSPRRRVQTGLRRHKHGISRVGSERQLLVSPSQCTLRLRAMSRQGRTGQRAAGQAHPAKKAASVAAAAFMAT